MKCRHITLIILLCLTLFSCSKATPKKVISPSTFCTTHSGIIQFIIENGTTERYCVFADTSRCKTTDFQHGACNPGESLDQKSLEEAKILAEGFIRNSPTYRYDGSHLAYSSIVPLDCPTCWQVVFEFSSQSSGYGNRINQNTLPITTLHQVQITIENGVIKKAFIDGKWDMLEEKMIS